MTWLVWRLYRAQGAIAVALLVPFAALVLVDGFHIASLWHTRLAACSWHNTCVPELPPLANPAVIHALFGVGILLPAVLGVLWGAPLVAQELESRTSDFAWAQSVTRTRWLAVKAGWLLLGAAVCGGAIAALTTWWSGPDNALLRNTFGPGQFDIQSIVPIGYALFAVALGITAGTVARRTLPAVAVTIGGFIAVRVVITEFVRQHYMTAVTTYYSVTRNFTPPGQAWPLGGGAVSITGRVVPQGYGTLAPALPAACQRFLNGPGGGKGGAGNGLFSCMRAHGWRGFATYQPGSRYWAFQGIETGIYVLLAAALIAVTFVIVRRRDAL